MDPKIDTKSTYFLKMNCWFGPPCFRQTMILAPGTQRPDDDENEDVNNGEFDDLYMQKIHSQEYTSQRKRGFYGCLGARR